VSEKNTQNYFHNIYIAGYVPEERHN